MEGTCSFATHTHVNVIRGTYFNIDKRNYKTFYRELAEIEINGRDECIAERIGESLPLIVSFSVLRTDCSLDNLLDIQVCLSEVVRKHVVCPKDGGFVSAVYWHTDRVYITYPSLSVTLNNLRLVETKLQEAIDPSWAKCQVSVLDEGYVRMCLGKNFEMIGTFIVETDTHTPLVCDPRVAFEDARLELYTLGMIAPEDVEVNGEEIYYYLYMSIHNITQEYHDLPLRKDVNVAFDYSIEQFEESTGISLDYDSEDVIPISDMIAMWKVSRFISISEWYVLGEICYNSFNSRVEGMEYWLTETSKILSRMTKEGIQIPDYLVSKVKDQVEIKYYTFKKNRITVKTAAWVAREDNPMKYAKWHMSWRMSSLVSATSGLVTEVSRAYYKKFFLDFVCEAEGKFHLWYYYDERSHKLVADKSMSEISKRTLWKFRNDFRKMKSALESKMTACNGEDENSAQTRDNYVKAISRIEGVEKKLAMSFGESVVKNSAKYFFNPDITAYLNANQDLLCAKTGVIVASRKGITIRAGRPEDYITKEIDAHFINMSWKHPLVLRILYWAKQTFIDTELVEYWLMFLASLLRGGNPDKIFPIVYGPKSNNSKSAWIRSIQKVLGSKCIKGTMAILTMEEKSPHGPTSLLVDFGEARLVLCEEAEEGGRQIRAGFIKNITGSDTYYAARKHKDGIQITPGFIIGIVTNSIPEFTTKDEAMKSRAVVIPTDSTWKPPGSCPTSISEQFEKRVFEADPYFDDTTVGFGEALLWIMCQYYPKYLEKGLVRRPKIIAEYTNNYWLEKDMFLQFVSERLTRTGLQNDSVSVPDVQDEFNEWYSVAYSKKIPPTRPKLVEELRRVCGDLVEGSWRGLKLKAYERKINDNGMGFVGSNPFAGLG